MIDRSLTGRRVVLLLAVIALAWAVAVYATGGFVIQTSWRRLSSRDAIRPFLIAAALATLYLMRWRSRWREDLSPIVSALQPRFIGGLAAAVALVLGLVWGTNIAGGPDASGYVSQADLLRHGGLTRPLPEWVEGARWNAVLAAAPVGWRATNDNRRLAPSYPPGFPLLMALFQIVAGPNAVFYVVPLLGAVLVWGCFMLGTRIGGPWGGAAAAALLLSSPTFLMQILQPMSDVPAAAFWTLALLATWRPTTTSALLAGVAVGMAVLIRPNLAPLAALVALLLLLHPAVRMQRLTLFAIAVVPSVVVIASLNTYYFGSPFVTGYGLPSTLYSIHNVVPNLLQYSRWFVASQTPLLLAALLAPLAYPRDASERSRVVLLTIGFPAAVLLLYLPYVVFEPHEWWCLRFLLPAYPVLMAGLGTVIVRWSTGGRWAGARVVALTVIAALIAYGWAYARHTGILTYKRGDQRYARAVQQVSRLPKKTVVLSLAHSGTLRFYTGRDVLRFEALPSKDLDDAVAYLRRAGYRIYLVGDEFEIDMFRKRFAGTGTVDVVDRTEPVNLQGVLMYAINESPEPGLQDRR